MEAHSVERKLAAIFATDVEGYSRLTGQDEVGTLRTLNRYRAIIDRLIASHRGRIFNTAVRRREVMLLIGVAMMAPRAVCAQHKAIPVIGYLSGTAPGPSGPFLAAFRQGLGETGYVEAQNVAIEYRWAEGLYDRLPNLAADLVDRNVSVIVASSGTPTAQAAKIMTSTVPIVFIGVGDPVAFGLVASLARPGGNLTGVSSMTTELMPKQVELLSELVPQGRGDRSARESEKSGGRAYHRRRARSGAHEGGPAPYPEGQHRKRARR